MDTEQAWTRLKAMTAADSAPVLSPDEIELLLTMHRLADAAGVAPGAEGWVPTWDLNRAALEGWRWKAGKAAGSFDFQADGASYNRSQILEHCERMIAQYRRRANSSPPLFTERTEVTDEGA
jgi:hypothetical protein